MKYYTHLDAHSFFVHNTGSTHKPKAHIKWEGFLEKDPDVFQIHYFDCIWRYTEWLETNKVFHMGNVSYIPVEEYDAAYHAMMLDCV